MWLDSKNSRIVVLSQIEIDQSTARRDGLLGGDGLGEQARDGILGVGSVERTGCATTGMRSGKFCDRTVDE